MSTSSPNVSPKTVVTAAAPASSHSHSLSVSGDPVVCPFCDKALPESILSRAGAPAPPTLPSGSASTEPVGSTTAIMTSEGDADRADASASKVAISEDDIRRWSTVAGVQVDPLPQLAPPAQFAVKDKEAAKPVPLLPSPPTARASPKPTGRFGFFAKGNAAPAEQDDDSDSDGIISGYARLGAPESDDDGDDGYESEKEIKFRPRPREEEKPEAIVDTPETPGLAPPIALKESAGAGDAELRLVLREVLSRVQALSQSHTELQSSHTTLLTSLKIARSNLVMAEANTEMLESELRRAKASAASAARTNTPLARVSGDATRPSIDTRASGSGKAGWFGRNKPASPTEAATRVSGDASRSPTDSDELRKLKSHLENQNTELEALKKGKSEIEAELEGLSQALFEEANKMVADERKRRAELEDTLNEVKGERAALRETVKVLGGRIQTPPPVATPNEAMGESLTLDKHYAALRRGIHHIVDGPTPGSSEPGTPPEGESEREDASDGETERLGPESPDIQLPGAFVPAAPAFDSEPNPWAANSPVAV